MRQNGLHHRMNIVFTICSKNESHKPQPVTAKGKYRVLVFKRHNSSSTARIFANFSTVMGKRCGRPGQVENPARIG